MLHADAPQANVTATTERHTLQARVDRAYFWGPRLAVGDHDAGADEFRVRVPATGMVRGRCSL